MKMETLKKFSKSYLMLWKKISLKLIQISRRNLKPVLMSAISSRGGRNCQPIFARLPEKVPIIAHKI
jgi:hypothetical protein